MSSDSVVARFMALFGEPKTSDPDLFFEEYRKALRGIEPSLLDEAATRIVRKAKFWPKPAEVIEECEHIAADRYRAKPIEPLPPRKEPTPEQKARANALIAELKQRMAMNYDKVELADETDWRRGQRDQFGEVRKLPGLTERSRRMQGDWE